MIESEIEHNIIPKINKKTLFIINLINILFIKFYFYYIIIMVIIMEIIKYAILGIIQGLTEPLPISSSGHLLVFRNLFNTNMFNDLNFEIFVNFASFLAILYIFKEDVIKLIKGFFSYLLKDKENNKKYQNDFKYCMQIVVSTIPAGIVGLLFKDKIESALATTTMVGIAFFITALSLFLIRNIKGKKNDSDITYKDALLIGLLQAVAIFPGISRSGTVLVGCLLRNFKREAALKYTFIMYFPISVATFALSAIDLIKNNTLSNVLLPYSAGFICSLIVTYFSYKWLSNIVKKGKLWKFSIYCILMGLFTLIYFR